MLKFNDIKDVLDILTQYKIMDLTFIRIGLQLQWIDNVKVELLSAQYLTTPINHIDIIETKYIVGMSIKLPFDSKLSGCHPDFR